MFTNFRRRRAGNNINRELTELVGDSSGGGGGEVETTVKRVRWWTDLIDEDMEFEIEMGGKFVLFEKILRECERVGDKLIVFSQSLISLDLIEKFLNHLVQV